MEISTSNVKLSVDKKKNERLITIDVLQITD